MEEEYRSWGVTETEAAVTRVVEARARRVLRGVEEIILGLVWEVL